MWDVDYLNVGGEIARETDLSNIIWRDSDFQCYKIDKIINDKVDKGKRKIR